MRLLYGTTNEGKLAVMRRALAPLTDIELIGLKDMEEQLRGRSCGKSFDDGETSLPTSVLPQIEETGTTPLENARLKARAYYDALRIPVFSCDTGLYFEGLPGELQPGVHVRTVGGKRLTDEEMTAYYSGLARKYGDITARYKNAVCFVLDDTHIYESMDDSLSGEAFLLTSQAHPGRQSGFPLDCLSKSIVTDQYYYDMEGDCQDDVALDRGFLEFFKEILG